jgi:hypothetical protein
MTGYETNLVSSSGATATWGMSGSSTGINYANGTNKGFFPISGITVTTGTAPTLTGPTSMSLAGGYSATSTGVYTITGDPAPTVTKTSGDAKITWNNTTKKLDIAAGLAAGAYPVVLKASNGVGTDATLTFTLTVADGFSVTVYTSASASVKLTAANPYLMKNGTVAATGTLGNTAVAHLDVSSNTLTLNGYNFDRIEYAEGVLNIKLEGVNTITGNATILPSFGIRNTGGGYITVYSLTGGRLNITLNTSLREVGGIATGGPSVNSIVTIGGNANVTITANTTASNTTTGAYGVQVFRGNVIIESDASLNVTAAAPNTNSDGVFGIYAGGSSTWGNVTINTTGSVTLSATGGAANVPAVKASGSFSLTKASPLTLKWKGSTPSSPEPIYTAANFTVTNPDANTRVYSYGTAPTTYAVAYNLNGGTGTTPTETPKAAGATFAAASAAGLTAPAGKQFKQWNTNSTGTGTAYAAGATVTMPAAALTLYAIWENIPASPLTFTDNSAYDIPASAIGTSIANINVSGGVSGGVTPYKFSATGLPAGVGISTAGVIGGSPTAVTAAGTATVTVTDAASATASISIAFGAVSKATQTAPAAPTLLSATATAITLNPAEGCEYSINGGAYTTGNTFGGLSPNTSYSFTRRRAETATQSASPSSAAATFKTLSAAATVYTITATVNHPDRGSITPAGAVPVEAGANITFTITPNSGSKVSDVLVNGGSVGAVTTYTFTSVHANGTIAVMFDTDTGNETVLNASPQIYPNPTRGQLTIDAGQLTVEKVEIYDMQGKIIFNVQRSTVNSIDISRLPAGIYFVRLQTRNGMFVQKVVKQ